MKGLSHCRACIVYAILLFVTIATNFILPGLGNLIWCSLLSTATLLTIIYFLCTKPSPSIPQLAKPQQEQAKQPEHAESLVSVNSAAPPPTRPSRLYYLDNLKSILTAIVVIHHTSMAFSSGGGWYYNLANYYNSFQVVSVTLQILDQSYFMCLFFFISGYFTPMSCDRKGVKMFLCDKFKRLGIPFIIYLLVLGPLLAFFINFLLISHNSWSYGPDPGPCWFLLWLLIFNVCYAAIDGNASFLKVKLPSVVMLVVYGALLGFVQYIVVMAIPDGNYIFMPIVIGSLPFDIVFFISGVAAKYNGWLVDSIPNLSKCNVFALRILTVFCALGMFSLCLVLYVFDFGHGFLPKKNESDHDCDSDDQDWSEYVLLLWGGIFMFAGICCTIFSVTFVEFAHSYLNFSNKSTIFFSKSAYTVYVIHPLIVVPVTWSFQALLEAANGQTLYFCKDTSVSKTHFSNNWLVWIGWIYSVVLSLIILWPLAWYIRKLPGLNKIL